jgi:hypothetical protein
MEYFAFCFQGAGQKNGGRLVRQTAFFSPGFLCPPAFDRLKESLNRCYGFS